MGSPTLFPPGTDQELLALRRRCASALLALLPGSVGRLFFGGSATSWLAGWFSSPSTSSFSSTPRSGPIITGTCTSTSGVGEDDDLDARIITGIETDILDVFSDPYRNKHLMYSALELIFVRLVPELAEKGIVELWEERLS